MSNHLAIATVTAALNRLLQKGVDTDQPNLSNARVSNLRPNAPADLPATGINVFLYQVTPNAARRNADLPTRRSDGTLLTRPRAALDLHYLLSFYGDDKLFEPQILLASAIRTLHAIPALDREAIQAVTGPGAPLEQSDLADALEQVRFTPTALSLEEMSKLWSVFFQSPYVLSIAYQASVVVVEAPLVETAPRLPVQRATVLATPLRAPVIEDVLSRSGPGQPALAQPILGGQILVVTGSDLGGDIVLASSPLPGSTTELPVVSDASGPLVLVDGVDTPTAAASATSLDVPLPATLRAGNHTLRVVRRAALGSPATPHALIESNVVGFVLCPSVSAAVGSAATVAVTLSPPLRTGQRVALLLNQTATALPTSLRVEAPKFADGATSLDFALPEDVIQGSYLVRLLVDGAQSPLGPVVSVGP